MLGGGRDHLIPAMLGNLSESSHLVCERALVPNELEFVGIRKGPIHVYYSSGRIGRFTGTSRGDMNEKELPPRYL